MVRLRLLSLALLSASAASALPQRSDWHAHYAGDSAPYGAPVDEPSSGEEWSGGGGGSAPGREWHSAYPPDPVVAEAQRRQYYEETEPAGGDGILSSLSSGLRDIGRHVVSGFSKLTGVDMGEEAGEEYYLQGDKSYYYGQQPESAEVHGNEVDGRFSTTTIVEEEEQSFFDKMKHSVMSLMPGGGDKPNKREIVRHHHHHHSSPPQQHQQQQQQQQQHQPSGIASRNRQPYQTSSSSSPVRQFASSSSSSGSAAFHLPRHGLFKIIPIPSDNPGAPPLYQIVPQVQQRADSSQEEQQVPLVLAPDTPAIQQQQQQNQPDQLYDRPSHRFSHPYQTDFGQDEPWRLEP